MNFKQAMDALTKGNVASTSVQRQLFAPADSGTGSSTNRQDSPDMKSRPDLG